MLQKIPVTVLTGFLGSGKTTLLNRILAEQHGLRIAVIENEFGEIGIDQDLVINADEEVFEMNNGCICCTVRGDLVRILGNLHSRREKFDRIILETTGMADPGPVAQTFFVDEVVREHYELDGIITLVDAKHVGLHLDVSDEVLAQIAFADKIILNKTDLVTAEEKAALIRRIRTINAMASITPAVMAAAPIAELLNVGGFNLARVLEQKPNFLEPEYPFEWAGIWRLPKGRYHLQLAAGPDPDMSLLACAAPDARADSLLTLAERIFVHFSADAEPVEAGVSLEKLEQHYRLALDGGMGKSPDLNSFTFPLRLPAMERLALFTQHTPEEFALRLLREDGTELTPVAEHFFNAGHAHDDEVFSVAVELPGLFDMHKINAWLDVFLQVHGPDVFRMKGIVGVKGEKVRYVFQGVHMLFTGEPGKPWGDEDPVNRMVFIGRNLDEQYIRSSLIECLV